MENLAYSYSRREKREDWNRVDMLLREPDRTVLSYRTTEGFLDTFDRVHSLEIRKHSGMTDIVIKKTAQSSGGFVFREEKMHIYSFDRNNHLVHITLIDGDQTANYANKNYKPSNAFSRQSPDLEEARVALIEPKLAKSAMQDITKSFNEQLVRMGERGHEYITKIDGVLTGASR